jgi:hypothetical protein
MTAIKSRFHFVGVTPNGPFSGVHMKYENQGEQDTINGIRKSFGILGNTPNMEDWKIVTVPENLSFTSPEDKNYCTLTFNMWPNYFIIGEYGITRVDFIEILEKEETVVAWDCDSFGIFTKKENDWWIKELYEAFLEKDVAIHPVKGEAYLGQPDLAIVILSKYL